jgi:glutamate synthase (ferredoxin)
LYNYFKQLFSSYKPPLDGIREEIITDISLAIGGDYNIFDIVPKHCKTKKSKILLSNEDLDKTETLIMPISSRSPYQRYTKSKRSKRLRTLEKQYKLPKAVAEGLQYCDFIRQRCKQKNGSIPMLLACSYIHHSLNILKVRSKFGILIESAEPREPHHFALLFVIEQCINPYMVNEIIHNQVNAGFITDVKRICHQKNYNKMQKGF